MIPYSLRLGLSHTRGWLQRNGQRVLFGTTPSWRRRPNVLPWFDQPDALDVLERLRRSGRISVEDGMLFEKWIRDGYVVIDGGLDSADIDAMIHTLDGLWDAPAPIPNLEIIGLSDEAGTPYQNLRHRDLLELDPARRHRMRQVSDWRIHGFHYFNGPAKRIYWSRRLRRATSRLFRRRARPIAAINFMSGSEQSLHQDMAVFHIYPHNYLIGAWIACEDIAEESGPLVFYPGSHRVGMFPGFTDYPQTNLRTSSDDLARRYQDYVDDLATRFPRREFCGDKGQVLLWHGMLIHGGAPVTARSTSRKSMVLHYSVPGADRGKEVRGPFRW